MNSNRTATRMLDALVRLALSGVVVVGGIFAAAPSASAAAPTFSISGAGYGHGIGLSQYGAKGYAEQGWKGEAIATRYYPGTTIGTVSDPTITVNIDPGKTSANEGFTQSSWRLRAGTGSDLMVNGSRALTADGIWTFTRVSATTFQATSPNGTVYGPWTEGTPITAKGASTLIEVLDGSGIYDWTRVRYRGAITFKAHATSSLLGALNVLPMQDYLKGVVPRESPAYWHMEALKAQAIVARSYAYFDATKPKPLDAEMYCTTWDQAYSGHSRYNATTASWEMLEQTSSNTAVDATKGKYVKYGSAVVQTFFHSSSGGHTANIEDVWLGSAPQPYYRGVADPYVGTSNNPWTPPVSIDGLAMATKLAARISGEPAGAGSTWWVKSLGLERAYPSGYVRRVDVTWTNGTLTQVTQDVSGDTFRSALGLKSTKFFINSPFTRISSGDRYETAVAVSKATFTASSTSVRAAVLVNGTDAKFADALTAAALAGQSGGPVLMVPGSTMPAVVEAELKRLKGLGFTKVYVIGGTASVSAAVGDKAKLAMGTSERLAGNATYGHDRYGTAATVAMEMKQLGATTNKVLIASGESWPDAAVAASIAAGSKRPVVLTGSRSLPTGSRRVLDDLGATESAIFGGTNAINSTALASIMAATGESTPAKRFGLTGSRYDVAVEAAKWAVSSLGFTLSTVYIASGEKFPDSVIGGLKAGREQHPLLMTPGKSPSTATSAYLAANRVMVTKVVVVGGSSSVSDSTASTLASYAY